MYKIYVIEEGDTPEVVANKVGISVEELRKINNLPFNYTFNVGEQIVVPSKNNESLFYYTIKQGDTIYGIARKNNVDPNLLLQINGMDANDYIYPGEKLIIPSNDTKTYLVLPNDTLKEVVKKLNTDVNRLLMENDIYLMPNQLLVLRER